MELSFERLSNSGVLKWTGSKILIKDKVYIKARHDTKFFNYSKGTVV